MIHSILADKATRLCLILGGFFVANALIAETIGVKLFFNPIVAGTVRDGSKTDSLDASRPSKTVRPSPDRS